MINDRLAGEGMTIFFDSPNGERHPTSEGRTRQDVDFVIQILDFQSRARALRHELFDGGVISDYSWYLLQDLFAAHLEGNRLHTKQICAISGLPRTTAMRYLGHLEKHGLVSREKDPSDKRVTLVSLTEAGVSGMHEYFAQLARFELSRDDGGKPLFDPKPQAGSSAKVSASSQDEAAAQSVVVLADGLTGRSG